MNLWSELSPILGKSLTTLGRGKPFDVVDIDEKYVFITPHATGIVRPIKRNAIQNAYDEICRQGSITLKGIRAFDEFNPVYIAAMLAQLPTVNFTNRPIQLTLVDGLPKS